MSEKFYCLVWQIDKSKIKQHKTKDKRKIPFEEAYPEHFCNNIPNPVPLDDTKFISKLFFYEEHKKICKLKAALDKKDHISIVLDSSQFDASTQENSYTIGFLFTNEDKTPIDTDNYDTVKEWISEALPGHSISSNTEKGERPDKPYDFSCEVHCLLSWLKLLQFNGVPISIGDKRFVPYISIHNDSFELDEQYKTVEVKVSESATLIGSNKNASPIFPGVSEFFLTQDEENHPTCIISTPAHIKFVFTSDITLHPLLESISKCSDVDVSEGEFCVTKPIPLPPKPDLHSHPIYSDGIISTGSSEEVITLRKDVSTLTKLLINLYDCLEAKIPNELTEILERVPLPSLASPLEPPHLEPGLSIFDLPPKPIAEDLEDIKKDEVEKIENEESTDISGAEYSSEFGL
ncbi:hypothetical protein ADUPG1_010367 [Aduncisulcus paluster]|uniref:Uncharacterized protein n=1 Tax=Aduncisulcus paluster TaxID=2918883 RepID=A0ABQ5JVB4_9EUKA|nr:hypothetical protein ADUPG1_010367 [Aduncisulcus paluster]